MNHNSQKLIEDRNRAIQDSIKVNTSTSRLLESAERRAKKASAEMLLKNYFIEWYLMRQLAGMDEQKEAELKCMRDQLDEDIETLNAVERSFANILNIWYEGGGFAREDIEDYVTKNRGRKAEESLERNIERRKCQLIKNKLDKKKKEISKSRSVYAEKSKKIFLTIFLSITVLCIILSQGFVVLSVVTGLVISTPYLIFSFLKKRKMAERSAEFDFENPKSKNQAAKNKLEFLQAFEQDNDYRKALLLADKHEEIDASLRDKLDQLEKNLRRNHAQTVESEARNKARVEQLINSLPSVSR